MKPRLKRPYVALYDSAEGGMFSGVIRFEVEWVLSGSQRHLFPETWSSLVNRLVDETQFDFAARFTTVGDSIERCLIILGLESDLAEYHRLCYIASTLTDQDIEAAPYPLSREEHDQIAGALPENRLMLEHQPFKVNSNDFACGFQLHCELSELLEIGWQTGESVLYQVNARRFQPDINDLRESRRNLVRLSNLRSVPATSLEHQRELQHQFEASCFLIDEFVGTHQDSHWRLLTDRIKTQFQKRHGPFGFQVPPLLIDETRELDEMLSMGFHSSRVFDAGTLSRVSGATDTERLKSLLNCTSVSESQATCRRIFISYRREDSHYIAGRIYDRLRDHFGADQVFLDVQNIPLGADFRGVLDEGVTTADTLLVIIGQLWLQNAVGKRRLEDPRDFVRFEVETALRNGLRVIALMVNGAGMPVEGDLPDCLRELSYRNGIQVRPDPDFHQDLDRLISQIQQA